MCSLRDHRWEGRKQEGQVLTLGWGLGTGLAEAASLPNPAGPCNVGLENVRLNSGPSSNSSLPGGGGMRCEGAGVGGWGTIPGSLSPH